MRVGGEGEGLTARPPPRAEFGPRASGEGDGGDLAVSVSARASTVERCARRV